MSVVLIPCFLCVFSSLPVLQDKASGNDYPKLSKPTGWTGDVGKGSQTAWDALPPKKWKPKS